MTSEIEIGNDLQIFIEKHSQANININRPAKRTFYVFVQPVFDDRRTIQINRYVIYANERNVNGNDPFSTQISSKFHSVPVHGGDNVRRENATKQNMTHGGQNSNTIRDVYSRRPTNDTRFERERRISSEEFPRSPNENIHVYESNSKSKM